MHCRLQDIQGSKQALMQRTSPEYHQVWLPLLRMMLHLVPARYDTMLDQMTSPSE